VNADFAHLVSGVRKMVRMDELVQVFEEEVEGFLIPGIPAELQN
jgi:hypothetical protein